MWMTAGSEPAGVVMAPVQSPSMGPGFSAGTKATGVAEAVRTRGMSRPWFQVPVMVLPSAETVPW